MPYRIDTIIPPTIDLVTLADVMQFARVDDSSDSAILTGIVATVTEQAQKFLNRAIGTQTLQLTIARNPLPGSPFPVSGWQSGVFNWTGMLNPHAIELPYGPVQAVNSVARGYWGQTPDTFLTECTSSDPTSGDYMTDLASLPARVRIITPAPSIYPGIDHISVQYQTGWDATSLIQISGTATATNTLNFLVGNQALAVSVTTGDTPLTVSQGILAAMAAYPSLPAAAILTPSMVQLRGSNPIVTIGNVPAGLTVTNTAPASEIPASIAQAIKLGSKWMYDQVVSSAFNASAYGEDLPPFFYHQLQQWKEWSFA